MSKAIFAHPVGNRFIPQKRSSRPARRLSNPAAQMWWAPRPWLGRLGLYRCVCLIRDELFVGVATQEGFSWVEANRALSPAEARAWTSRRL